MYSPFQSATRYLQYYLRASNGRGHGVHSPFVYSFIREVLNDDRHFYAYSDIESLRQRAVQEVQETIPKDLALHRKKFGQLLFRMVDHYSPSSIIELGTSSGFTTSYLASANTRVQMITIDTQTSQLVRQRLMDLRLEHIEIMNGAIENLLPTAIGKLGQVDFVFMGDHLYPDEMLHCFHQLLPAIHSGSMLIFNGIHRSRETEQAWKKIQTEVSVTLTIDLFFIGIVLFRKENKAQQHFTIRF